MLRTVAGSSGRFRLKQFGQQRSSVRLFWLATTSQQQQQQEQEQQQPQDRDKGEDEQQQRGEDARLEKLILETYNATSLNSNRATALARNAHLQAIQEACLIEAQIAGMKRDAAKKGNIYIGGPTDFEQGKVAAGVGALFLKELAAYPIPKPTEGPRDAEKSGRCKIV